MITRRRSTIFAIPRTTSKKLRSAACGGDAGAPPISTTSRSRACHWSRKMACCCGATTLRQGSRRTSASVAAGAACSGARVSIRKRSKRRPKGRRTRLCSTRTFPALAPNKIMEAVGRIDKHLNDALGDTLRARLRPLRRAADGTFTLGEDAAAALAGSWTAASCCSCMGRSPMRRACSRSSRPPKRARLPQCDDERCERLQEFVFFEHATLAVSPIVNALELGRMFANASGQIDVIAHSRGGLVVRWWLEAFGKSLNVLPAAPVRAILVGSPLNGTSLAAPDKLQGALSLVSNIGSVVETTLGLAGAANPFLWVAESLCRSSCRRPARWPARRWWTAWSRSIPGLVRPIDGQQQFRDRSPAARTLRGRPALLRGAVQLPDRGCRLEILEIFQ